MNHLDKVRRKIFPYLSFAFLILLINTGGSKANFSHHSYSFPDVDTVPKTDRAVTTQQPNSLNRVSAGTTASRLSADTIVPRSDTFSVRISKDSLDAPVSYSAEDSMTFDVETKKIILYGKETKTVYKDNELTAPNITFDQSTGNVTATLKRDSAGKVISMARFKQGEFDSQSDTIKFNTKTGKGITKGTYTQQGEMYVYGQVIKKVDNEVFYAYRGRFTTCDLDTPHFAFVSNRIKFVSKKLAITGPVHPEFEGVPVPAYLPFGIYPLSQGRRSGILAPQFTANEQLGLALEGLGYYKVLSDYWDVILRGNIYSYGGWTGSINPRYMKRYRYQGSLSFNMQNFKYNFKGDPDFRRDRSYNLTWSHSADMKARPGVTFSANVNAGSSSFNNFIPNNPVRNFNNILQSSIVYSKTWKDKPYNITVSANHNQNTNLKLVNVNLPDVAFNVATLYPFRRKEAVGDLKWYENFGIAYNGNAKSLFSFYDTAGNILKQIKDTFQWGATHNIPITLSLPSLGAIQVAPGISYVENWYQRKFERRWNPTEKKVDTIYTRGFYTARDMAFSLGFSTRLFGLYTAGRKDARIQAIRHEIRPSWGISYRPDLNSQNFYRTQVDTFGREFDFNLYEGNIFGTFSREQQGNINFSLDNNIQMKVRNRKDTSEEAIRKVTIIDGLRLDASYNLLADSFNLSPLTVSARSTLFRKLDITANATMDPYDVDARGERINRLLWRRKPLSLGRLMSGNIAASSQFQGGANKDSRATGNQSLPRDSRGTYSQDEFDNELNDIYSNPGQYADFSIPWSVNFAYSLSFFRQRKGDYSGFETIFQQHVNLGGSLRLSPKWQTSLNGSYNISEKQLGLITVSISREMHCWQMSINMTPVGRYRYFSINISPKSGLLRDLKINRTRYTYDL
jgi:LPS-assembly protein